MRCGPAAPVRSSFYRVENNNVRLQMRRIHAARSSTNSLINDLGAFVGCIAGEAKTIMLKMTIIRATGGHLGFLFAGGRMEAPPPLPLHGVLVNNTLAVIRVATGSLSSNVDFVGMVRLM